MDSTSTQPAEERATLAAALRSETVKPLALHSLLFPAALYLILVGSVLIVCLRYTGGHLVYALDDTYIHMAIAKNLAAHGVFGVTSYVHASASSSILWPFLLAAFYKLFGPVVAIPLILQIVLGIGILATGWWIFNRLRVTSDVYVAAALSVLVVAVPMVAMTMVAMEHLLHLLAALLFAFVVSSNFDGECGLLPVFLCAALVSSVRYEGAFEVAAAALLYLLAKRASESVVLLGAGATPIVLFGLYSVSNGGYFLPNSVLLKRPDISPVILLRLIKLVKDCPEVFVLGVAALFLLALNVKMQKRNKVLLKIFLLTLLLHNFLACYGWFYRYEAYLVGLGIVTVAAACWEYAHRISLRLGWATVALLALLTPLLARGLESTLLTPAEAEAIYRQQYQMARFFQTYYPGGRIATGDIGAVTYYSDPRLTDLFGLGDTSILRAQIADRSLTGSPAQAYPLTAGPNVLNQLHSSNLEVAAVHDHALGLNGNNVPPGWILAGKWENPSSPPLVSPEVSFYGVGIENARRLRRHLQEFHNQLPREIAPYAYP
jgi:hypothetical protein